MIRSTTTVVVADDQPDSRALITTLLGYRGYRILEASDGEEALALIDSEHPDLVISDLLMPRMDGFELAKRLRSLPSLCHIPVIFYTAVYHAKQAAALATECGAAALICKPVEPQTVFEVVDRALAGATLSRDRSADDGGFTDRHTAVVREKAAEQAARLHAAQQRLLDLAALGQSLVLEADAANIAHALCAKAREILLVREMAVALTDDPGATIILTVRCGADGALRAAHDRRTVPPWLTDPGVDESGLLAPPCAAGIASLCGLPAGGAVAVPIATATTALGWLCAARPVGGEMSDLEQAAIATMAAHAACALETARHRTRVRQQSDKLANETQARERAEHELRTADQQFARLFDMVLDGMLHVDCDRRLARVNPALVAMLGYDSPEELLGTATSDLFCEPGARDAFVETIDATGQARNLEIDLERKGGGVVHALLSGRAVHGADGAIRFYEGIARDVTERKQAQLEQRKLEEQTRFALRAARCGVWQFDAASGSLACGDTMTRVLGIGPEDLPSSLEALLRLVHADDRGRVESWLSGASAGMSGTLPFRTMWPDGSAHWLEAAGRRSEEHPGELPLFIGVAIDVTERKRLEAQFHQAQKIEAIGRLAGGIAHDFNNLITIILGYADAMQGELESDDPLVADLKEIARAGGRAAGLTAQLLAFSRRQFLQPKAIDVNHLITEMAPMLARLIGEDVALVTEFEKLEPVMADTGQMEQVLMNLAINARDAMPGGGTLRLATAMVDLDEAFAARHAGAPQGRHVAMTVADTGVGMDESTLEHIFEPFFTTKESGKGTGLGLATVYGIVKQSGGYVAARSEPGRGASFTVYLPAAMAATRSDEAVAAAPAPGTGTETVLLAEDEIALRRLMKTVLERHGYSVLDAVNMDEALALAAVRGDAIDLLLTDVIMPGGTGTQLAERLRQKSPHLKVLFTSGYTHERVGGQRLLAPGAPFLQKPFTSDQILRRVRQVLDAK